MLNDAISDRTFVRRVLIALLLIGLGCALWAAAHAILLLFGAVLFAVILRGLADLLPLPDRWAVTVVILLLAMLFGLAGWLMGATISEQFSQLTETLPDSLQKLERQLRSTGWGREVMRMANDAVPFGSNAGGAAGQSQGGGITGQVSQLVQKIGQYLLAAFGALGDLVLVLIGGIYLAYEPSLYRIGVQKLAPKDETALIRRTLDSSGEALWKWSVGTLIGMAVIGLLTGTGLWLLGVPAPMALGLIAGLLEFVPMLGPILAAIPAVLLAFTQDAALALWTALFYLLLQQFEGNILFPIIQRRAVALPPVVTLFALLVFGTLFGIVGVIFATPLAVVLMVWVQILYVEQGLGKPVTVSGS